MPCYTVSTISIDFVAGDRESLIKAVEAIGLEIYDYGTGRIDLMQRSTQIATLQGGKASCKEAYLPIINGLRVAYSKQIINKAALKTGWQKVAKTANKFVLRKGC